VKTSKQFVSQAPFYRE